MGLATLGNIAIYLPLCDGNGRQVAGGMAEELLYESIRYGYSNLDDYWNKSKENRPKKRKYRYETRFSPPEFVIALDELIVREGVEILFDATFSEPVMDNKRCKGVLVETKLGRKYYEASAFVDATGDGDLFIRAGADYQYGKNWLAIWAYSVSSESIQKAIEKNEIMNAINLEIIGKPENATDEEEVYDLHNKVFGLNNITQFILESRQMLKNKVLDQDNKKQKTLVNLPCMPLLRTTCRLIGSYTLTEADLFKTFDDSIGVIGDWRKPNDIYEIPYRSIISPKLDNIFVAGRCISSSGNAWEVTRVIPTAAITGEAAGIAAAEAVKSKKKAQKLNVSNIQKCIQDKSGRIHFSQ